MNWCCSKDTTKCTRCKSRVNHTLSIMKQKNPLLYKFVLTMTLVPACPWQVLTFYFSVPTHFFVVFSIVPSESMTKKHMPQGTKQNIWCSFVWIWFQFWFWCTAVLSKKNPKQNTKPVRQWGGCFDDNGALLTPCKFLYDRKASMHIVHSNLGPYNIQLKSVINRRTGIF